MRKPSNSPMTPGYGFGSTLPPYSPSNPHKGTDFQHSPDNIIYAPFSGRVAQGYNDRDGNGSYMTDPQDRFHGMLHASKYLVPDGTSVTEGQPIAVMGETGLAQGVHLHWAVKENGVFIDPMSLIKEEEDMPNKGDVTNAKRFSTGVSDYVPSDAEVAYFQEHGFKALLYDTIEGGEVQVKLAAHKEGYKPINETVYVKE